MSALELCLDKRTSTEQTPPIRAELKEIKSAIFHFNATELTASNKVSVRKVHFFNGRDRLQRDRFWCRHRDRFRLQDGREWQSSEIDKAIDLSER